MNRVFIDQFYVYPDIAKVIGSVDLIDVPLFGYPVIEAGGTSFIVIETCIIHFNIFFIFLGDHVGLHVHDSHPESDDIREVHPHVFVFTEYIGLKNAQFVEIRADAPIIPEIPGGELDRVILLDKFQSPKSLIGLEKQAASTVSDFLDSPDCKIGVLEPTPSSDICDQEILDAEKVDIIVPQNHQILVPEDIVSDCHGQNVPILNSDIQNI